jgi:hypothetical protein
LFPAYIDLWGKLWNDQCPRATEYVFVTYTYGTDTRDPQVAQSGYAPPGSKAVGVSEFPLAENDYVGPYAYIKVDACDDNAGWHCATAQGPGALPSRQGK